MDKIIREYIETPYSNKEFEMNYIKSAIYQKCIFDVKGLMPNIERSIFEDCIFENMEFTKIAKNTVFRKCTFKKIKFYTDPRPYLEGVIFEECLFKSSTISWRMENGIIDSKFEHCIFYAARFDKSKVKLEFSDSGELCSLREPHSALIAPYESLAFSNCSKLEFVGFLKNDGFGIIQCDTEDLPKIAPLLGVNRER